MKKAVLIVIVVCLSAFCAFAQSRLNIRLAAETTVENNIITLGDIAEISGAVERAERLRKISLGYAPNIGATREIPKAKISMAIAAAGFTANEFSLETPLVVWVRRAGQEISGDQIREAIEKSVLSQFEDNKIEARIVRINIPEKVSAPVGKLEIRSNIAIVQNPFAPFAMSVEIRVNDKVIRQLPVNVEIEAFAEIFVAAKDLSTGAKISETDVQLEKRRLEKPLTSYLRDAEKLRGVKLIKNLSSGAELTSDSFVADTVVRSGDLVRIVGSSGKLQIAVNGQARTSGKIGDRISVKNSQSNLIIQATVVDEGLVKVFF